MSLTTITEASIFNSLLVYNNSYDNTVNGITGSQNVSSTNLALLNSISEANIFDSFLKFETDLKNPNNYTIDQMDSTYDFRPDKLAKEKYNDQTLYPAILICNDVCSLLQFRPALLNFSVKIPTPEIISYIISKL